MSYRIGLGLILARRLGEQPGPPRIICDSCDATYEVKARGAGGPPAWFINGKAPPRWRTERTEIGDGVTRRDWCPACKDDEPAPVAGKIQRRSE